MAAPKNAIVWFRKGLRLHDNPALLAACEGAAHVYPVFIIDPHFLQNTSYNFRARGSRLLVLRGTPEDVLPRVFRDWKITQLCYEVDVEPYARSRDASVAALAAAAGVEVSAHTSHTLYDPAALIAANGGRPPLTMQAFTKLVDRAGDPPPPAGPPPAALPPPDGGAAGAGEEGTGVPTLAEVGFPDAPTAPFKGGETEALRRLEASMADAKWVCGFEKPATDPSAFERPATTVLSPYLKFGCLSPRLFHQRLLRAYKAAKGAHSKPPVSLRGQLLWREFFYAVGSATPNFQRMEGNPICKQARARAPRRAAPPLRCSGPAGPSTVSPIIPHMSHPLHTPPQIAWDTNPELLAAWREGRTGYPWIDAIMSQLRQWGWVHHLARHSAACFLTRGDLYLSWEAGAAVFEELLLDADHFLNAANWQWLSASAFFNQYYRVYSPVTFGKKYDPNGSYIRKFVPQLAKYPSKYIYEPWTAPLEVQRACGCVVGRDYPFPVVEHTAASRRNMERMKAAYAASRWGAWGRC
ncbi:MAG: FAD binding domain of DNA photolyase-domain-containing protein [Monoraphidium minutum]|nr:MAG: FAD binding domain of DNA photolyase-domain-containing protein [Monoraphidium minutum]